MNKYNNKYHAPLYCAVKKYKKNLFRYHMPGHKGSRKLNRHLGKLYSDITELSFSGNLFSGNNVIMRSEKLFAECYNAGAVKFSTCGTTVNIISMLYSLRGRGSIIIQKNSHKSVYSALEISNITPVIIDCCRDDNGLYMPVTPRQIENAVKENPDCIGALVTSPDYYGFCADLTAIKKALGGRLLIVDAAHGSHLPFINKYIFAAADAYFCSAHKNLPCITPSAFTVFNNTELYQGFAECLEMFHTSSPSFPALSSMDFARRYMQIKGVKKLENIKKLRSRYVPLFEKAGYTCLQNDDFTKLIIRKKGISGKDIAKYLEERGIFFELSDNFGVLALFTVCDGERQFKKLYKELKRAAKSFNDKPYSPPVMHSPPAHRAMPYLDAASAPREKINIKDAAGRIAARNMGLFPPCYPLVCCGEVISAEMRDFLINNKHDAFGVDNGCVYVVK